MTNTLLKEAPEISHRGAILQGSDVRKFLFIMYEALRLVSLHQERLAGSFQVPQH